MGLKEKRKEIESLSELDKIFEKNNYPRAVIFFIGNLLKGDDGVAPYIVEKIVKSHSYLICSSASLLFIDCESSPEKFSKPARNFKPRIIVFVDCVDFSAEPGEIGLFSVDDVVMSSLFTHGLPLNFIKEEIAKEITARFFLLGVQPAKISVFYGLTEKVESSAHKIYTWLVNLIEEHYKGVCVRK